MAHFRKKDFQIGLNRTEAKYLIEKKEGTYSLAKNKQMTTTTTNNNRKQIKSKNQINLPKEPKAKKRQNNPRNSKSTEHDY